MVKFIGKLLNKNLHGWQRKNKHILWCSHRSNGARDLTITIQNHQKNGIDCGLIYFIKMLLPFFETDSNDVLITGIIISIVAIPLLLSKETLAVAAGNSKLIGRFFVSAFGFREESFRQEAALSRHYNNVMIFLGMFFGVLTFFLHPLYMPILFGILMLVLLTFASPEIGVLTILAGFPFLSYPKASGPL